MTGYEREDHGHPEETGTARPDKELPEEYTEDVNEEAVAAGPSGEVADEETAGDDPREFENLRQELEVVTRQARENLELAQRAQAEMDNLRKRTARDVENAHKYALERFVQDLLPVIDSLELGINAASTAGDAGSLLEGMDLTLKKFVATVEKYGVAVVDPQGEKFNPEKHEAVSMTQAEGTEPGSVISVLQKGYELNGRLVRPAMVVVAR